MNGYGNPYGYPYSPGYQQQMYGQQMPQRYELVKVSGRGGVDALRVAPRSELLAMDTSRTDVLLAWYIQADDAGYKSVTPYVLTPYTEATPIDAANIEQRLKRLEEIIVKLSGEEIQHAQILQGASAHQVATQDQAHPLSNDGKTLTDWIKSCQDERIRDVKRMHEAYQAAK